MKETNVLTKIKLLLGLVQLEAQKLEDGVTIIEAETFEEGKEVFVVNEETKVPLPEGSYILEDARVLEVDANGIILKIGEAEAEPEAEAEAPVEPEAEVEAQTEAPMTPKKIIESVTKETHLAEIKKLEDLILEKDAKITELSAVKVEEIPVVEAVELAETPAVVHSPEAKTKSNQIFKIKKSQSTKARVWESLFN